MNRELLPRRKSRGRGCASPSWSRSLETKSIFGGGEGSPAISPLTVGRVAGGPRVEESDSTLALASLSEEARPHFSQRQDN